jgi:hypothetical protein
MKVFHLLQKMPVVAWRWEVVCTLDFVEAVVVTALAIQELQSFEQKASVLAFFGRVLGCIA